MHDKSVAADYARFCFHRTDVFELACERVLDAVRVSGDTALAFHCSMLLVASL